jgi:hypothetical protein
MAYQKRTSKTLEKGHARFRALDALKMAMNLGDGLSLQGYAALLEASEEQLQAHNLALAEVDRTRVEFADTEKAVAAMSSRILTAVAAVYGKDSKEYELAGGKPRKSSSRAKKPGTTTSTTVQGNGSSAGTAASNGATMNGATIGN